MAKKRGLSADEKKQKMLQSMLAGVMEWKACNVVAIGIQHEGAGKDGKRLRILLVIPFVSVSDVL